MRNGDHTFGLFQEMFEKNILTFNPGWDKNAEPLAEFLDMREIQRRLDDARIEIESKIKRITRVQQAL